MGLILPPDARDTPYETNIAVHKMSHKGMRYL